MKNYKAIITLVLITGALLVWRWQAAEPAVAATPNIHRITDESLLFANEDDALKQTLSEYIAFMLSEFDVDLHIHTTTSDEDINMHSFALFEQLNVGDLSKTQKGLLLIVNPAQNKVRLEVGYELEDVYQDAFVAYIEHRQMVPFFQRNEVAMGVIATIELMVTRAQFAQLGKEEPYRPWLEGSGGGGAVVDANINKPDDSTTVKKVSAELQQRMDNLSSFSSPLDVVNLDLAITAERIGDWDLPVYARSSRRMLKNRPVTIAQMDNTVRIYKACATPEVLISKNRLFAVARYKTHQRLCAPWLLMREDGVWRIDILAHAYGMRNNFSNEWYFDGTIKEIPYIRPYLFAFPDWYVTKKGYFYMYRWQVSLITPQNKCIPGTKITRVTMEMPAYRLGLRVGDQPIRFNGETVRDNCHFLSMLFKVKKGANVEVDILRNGKRKTLSGIAPPHVGGMEGIKDKLHWTKLNAWMTGLKGVLSVEEWNGFFPDYSYSG
ncbi:MAG: PDZ domain-containing protein [Ketobacter sp.]|nr:MAG: PDZ domain-containing protein [Ketobacter sp.]